MACLSAAMAFKEPLEAVEAQVTFPILDLLVARMHLGVGKQNRVPVYNSLEVHDHNRTSAPDECVMAEGLQKLAAFLVEFHIAVVSVELDEPAFKLLLTKEICQVSPARGVFIQVTGNEPNIVRNVNFSALGNTHETCTHLDG